MPNEPLEHWNKVRRFWCEAVRICVDCPQEASVDEAIAAIHTASGTYGARSLRNAVRWIVRSHSLGIGMPSLGEAPVIRLLSKIFEILSESDTEENSFRESDPELKRLWGIFN